MSNTNIFKFNNGPYLVNNNPVTSLEYICTFVKGKKPTLPNDYRFVMKTVLNQIKKLEIFI